VASCFSSKLARMSSSKAKKTALLIIDMINTLDFPEGKQLLRHALPVARNIQALKQKFRSKNFPIIYVNDNYGIWKSDWLQVYEHCTQAQFLGAQLCPLIKPEDKDYFVLKPKHSGFFGTNLNLLLEELGVKKLVLTGIAGNICVLFTANDAYMRGFELHVPEDGIASNTKKDNDYALKQFRDVFGIAISGSIL
jgi:nicotinamidase-related amidase